MLTSFAIFLLNEALKKAKQMDQKSLIRTRTISHNNFSPSRPPFREKKILSHNFAFQPCCAFVAVLRQNVLVGHRILVTKLVGSNPWNAGLNF